MIRVIFISFIFFFLLTVQVYSQKKIGVALPMMKNSENTEEKKLGEQMLKGINDALEEYNNAGQINKISISAEDTKKDQTEVLQIFNKFGSDSNVIAILGPVFSSELINNEGAASFHKIPIITPTATENFLAEKNPFVFQLNPTYDIRGRLMADFAAGELKLKNFVIFSEDTYGKNYADSFTDEVNKNGGEIIYTKYYSKDSIDLTAELEDLKDKIFEKDRFIDFGTVTTSQMDKLKKVKFLYSYPDSLYREKLVVSIYKLFGKDAIRVTDSIGMTPVQIKYTDNAKQYILGYADAVYIPISNSGEISKVIPQYFSSNIKLPVLGTSDWNNEAILIENKMYIDQLYFDADFYIKDKSRDDFANMDESEIRNYYFGYDAMKLILDKISSGNNTRQLLNSALESVSNYAAVHCNFTIKGRTNHQMPVMKFRNGGIEKLKDFIY
ncbi:MAG: penicillin-binding protein activator [Ignavibacteria bacterium]|nr:penicillin-binding protein activator [Ignavibacteria bacterium]